MTGWILLGLFFVLLLVYKLTGKKKPPIIITVPDPDSGRVYLIAKPAKTWWINFKDAIPYMAWTVFIFFPLGLAVGAILF